MGAVDLVAGDMREADILEDIVPVSLQAGEDMPRQGDIAAIHHQALPGAMARDHIPGAERVAFPGVPKDTAAPGDMAIIRHPAAPEAMARQDMAGDQAVHTGDIMFRGVIMEDTITPEDITEDIPGIITGGTPLMGRPSGFFSEG